MRASSYFYSQVFYIFKSSSFVFAPSPSIAHVQRVTYRGEVPSAHRELVQSTAATSRPTTPRPIRRQVPQSVSLDPRGRGRIRRGGEPLSRRCSPRREEKVRLVKRRRKRSLVLPAGVLVYPQVLVWSVPVLAVRVCLAWCGLIKEAVSGSIAGRLVLSHSSAFVLAGVQRSFSGPWSLVLRCWRRVRVLPMDKLDQTARGGKVQIKTAAIEVHFFLGVCVCVCPWAQSVK